MKNQKQLTGITQFVLAMSALDRRSKKSLRTKISKKSGAPAEAGSKLAEDKRRWPLPHSWRLFAIVGASCALLLLLGWAVGNKYLAHFKLGNTSLNANLSDKALAGKVASATKNYRLTIAYPDGSKKAFTLSDMGFTVDTSATVARLRAEQGSLASRLHWWQTIPVKLILTSNQTTLNDFIAKHADFVVQPAKDASLSVQNGTVQLASASAGKQYGLANAKQLIPAQVSRLQTTPLRLKTLALKPAITRAELTSSEATLQKILQQHISLNIGGQTINPSPGDIAAWLQLTPNIKTKTVGISVNSSQVAAYINKIVSAVIHPPRDQVDITAANGSVSILVPGSTGEQVSGEQSTAAALAQGLLAAQGMQFSLPVHSVAYGTITAGNWSKWIEVDLTNKRLYAYQYNQLVNTFLVTAGKPSTPTPVGQFAIWEKLTSQTMIGPGYVQPHVPWVNYFDHAGDAIHGNYWQPVSAFGNVNTSHGCVGLQDTPAQWIYSWAPIGTPVITHV